MTKWLAAAVSLAAFGPNGWADEPKGGAKPENPFLGTWKLASAS